MLLTFIVILGMFFAVGVCAGMMIEERRRDKFPYAKASHKEMQAIFKKLSSR